MEMYNPIVTQAVADAGGQAAVSKKTKRVQPSVFKWTRNGLPRTEWTGETNYASVICDMANRNPNRSRDWSRDDLLSRELRPIQERVSA